MPRLPNVLKRPSRPNFLPVKIEPNACVIAFDIRQRIRRSLHEVDSGFDADRTGGNDVNVFRKQRSLLRHTNAGQAHQQRKNKKETIHCVGFYDRINRINKMKSCASIARMRRVSIFFLALICLATVPNAGHTISQEHAVEIKGIKDRITIRRDDRGIPYVEAQNDEDLYFGQGYATAADRLWQMDLFRRTARGELAEILGAGPNNFVLEQDKLHRTYGFAQTAEAEAANASPKTRALLA